MSAVKVLDLPDDHVMAVGLPNMYTMVKIINRQTNELVASPEEQGEICIKSPQNFIGYLGNTKNDKVKMMDIKLENSAR